MRNVQDCGQGCPHTLEYERVQDRNGALMFMQPEVTREDFVEVWTKRGALSAFPADLVSLPKGRAFYHGRRNFRAACEAVRGMHETYGRDDVPATIRVRERWAARLSAPGYMDATEWTFGDSQWAALKSLHEMYGDDCETADAIAAEGGPAFDPCDDRTCAHCHAECEEDCDTCFETVWTMDEHEHPNEREAREDAAMCVRELRRMADRHNEPGDADPWYVMRAPESFGGGWELVRPDRCDNVRLYPPTSFRRAR